MCTITWESSWSELKQASTDAIIQRFDEAEPVSKHNMNVRRLSETAVLKRTSFGSKREYGNQMLAWKGLNSERLRVPEPIRYIKHEHEYGILYGYLIMEYLHGTPVEEANNEGFVDTVAQAILEIHTRSRGVAQYLPPGPPTGGLAEGFPWGQNGAENEFHTVQDLEECVNKRLINYARSRQLNASDWKLDLHQSDFGLCHLDLAPRNILILHDGNIGIVDWNTLAHYPVVFELASLWCFRDIAWSNHIPFFELLMSNLERSTHVSEEDSIKLEIVQSQSIQYSL